jgi:hypothetical protein
VVVVMMMVMLMVVMGYAGKGGGREPFFEAHDLKAPAVRGIHLCLLRKVMH